MKLTAYSERIWFLLFTIGLCSATTKKKVSTSMVGTSLIHTMSNTHYASRDKNILRVRTRVLTRAWTNEDNCGKVLVTSKSNQQRIVGGVASKQGEWPWQAMILRYYDSVGDFRLACGGTLIKPQWVLTAGHCFDGEETSFTHVALGATWRNLTEASVKRFAVASIVCHEDYVGSSNAFKDDICLIKLAGPVTYTNFIVPGCLPVKGQTRTTGESCSIIGWGETQGTGSNSILQKASVKIISDRDCASWYGSVGITIPPDHFCAGYQAGGIDSCQGDSGGPLSCSRTDFKSTSFVTFGVVSFGIGCAEKERPGVYTDVPTYVTWIEKTITEHPTTDTDNCFSASALLTCGSTVIRNSGTIVRTPVDSTETWLYPPNTHCSWELDGPPGSTIRLEFLCVFHIEIDSTDNSRCYDYMKINSEEADLQVIYCGTKLLTPIRVLSNRATLSFHSDQTVQSSGFVVRVLFVGGQSITVTDTAKTLPDVNVTLNNAKTVFAQTQAIGNTPKGAGTSITFCSLWGLCLPLFISLACSVFNHFTAL